MNTFTFRKLILEISAGVSQTHIMRAHHQTIEIFKCRGEISPLHLATFKRTQSQQM